MISIGFIQFIIPLVVLHHVGWGNLKSTGSHHRGATDATGNDKVKRKTYSEDGH